MDNSILSETVVSRGYRIFYADKIVHIGYFVDGTVRSALGGGPGARTLFHSPNGDQRNREAKYGKPMAVLIRSADSSFGVTPTTIAFLGAFDSENYEELVEAMRAASEVAPLHGDLAFSGPEETDPAIEDRNKNAAWDRRELTGQYDLSLPLHAIDPYVGESWLIVSGHPQHLGANGWLYVRADDRIGARVRPLYTEMRSSRPERTGGTDAGDRGEGRVVVVDPNTWERVNYDLTREGSEVSGQGLRYLTTDDEDRLQHIATGPDIHEPLGQIVAPVGSNDGYGTALVESPEGAPFTDMGGVAEPEATKRDYENEARLNRRIGQDGEGFVVRAEKKRLIDASRPDLAERVEWVAETRGDGLGYDVLSFDPKTGAELHIEVKATTGAKTTKFFISRAEVDYSSRNPEVFWLYRVFNLGTEPKFYRLAGDMNEVLHLRPTQYEARPNIV